MSEDCNFPGIEIKVLRMPQLQKRDRQGGAINPFIAVYHAAQQAPDLINGAQQDIHEFWMTLKDLLNQDAGTRVSV